MVLLLLRYIRGFGSGNKEFGKVGRTMATDKKLNLHTDCNGGTIMPGELPDVRIDYNGLLAFAKKKGVPVIELTEEEKKRFVSHA